MTTSMIAAILFLFSVWTSFVQSSCLRGPLASQLTAHGHLDEHCLYKEMKVLPGSTFRISAPECLECKCSKKGLVCCGFGFSAGLVQGPEGCIAYNDACRLVFVKKDNVSAPCLSSESLGQGKKFKIGQSIRRS